MRTEQARLIETDGWNHQPGALGEDARLVLLFAAPRLLSSREIVREIERDYQEAIIVGCSTAGEIADVEVTDESLVLTALAPAATRIRCATLPLPSPGDSQQVGLMLAERLTGDELVHVLVFSDGRHVNGSKLAQGLTEALPAFTHVTGGLAGDGERFTETLILAEGTAAANRVTAIGFYGDRLRTGCGSFGGWDPFGPERLITRSEANILHELDGRPALDIYRRYLGPYEEGLPATALLFPLALRRQSGEPAVVRTVLSIDDDRSTMTFAGEMPEGSYARFMKANFDRLVGGATKAAALSQRALDDTPPDFALLISCVGRKMVLKQRVEEEIEGVRQVLGSSPIISGFYSYGEISPFEQGTECRLHNQTMTVTTFREV